MYIVDNLVRIPLPNLMSPFLYSLQCRAEKIVARNILNKLVPENEWKKMKTNLIKNINELVFFFFLSLRFILKLHEIYHFIKWW